MSVKKRCVMRKQIIQLGKTGWQKQLDICEHRKLTEKGRQVPGLHIDYEVQSTSK